MALLACSSPPLLILCLQFCFIFSYFCLDIDSLRASLENEEDFIIYSLIERARYPYNSNAYDPLFLGKQNISLVELFVRETEAMEAKYGRYQNHEELPFFPEVAQFQLLPSHKFPNQILYPPAASVNVSKIIWDVYFKELLPLLTTTGDDGNYQQTVASDLIILQALSKRIHTGRFVAEIKFRNAPQSYLPAIHTKDLSNLLKLVTVTSVEDQVVERVFKKAKLFGQVVILGNNVTDANDTVYKVKPSVASKLYHDWVIPLTKQVEVEYLLRRKRSM